MVAPICERSLFGKAITILLELSGKHIQGVLFIYLIVNRYTSKGNNLTQEVVDSSMNT